MVALLCACACSSASEEGGGTGGPAAGGSGGTDTTSTGGAGGAGGALNAEGKLRDYLGHPDYPDDFWQPSSPDASGIDARSSGAALDQIESSAWPIHSFLIAHRGRLVLERYGWNDGTNPAISSVSHQVLPSERQPTFSTTKSVLSALIGIALDDGLINDLSEPAVSYFPDYEDSLEPSPEKSMITLEDLLTMRSGLEWAVGDQTTFEAPDPARAMLARPVVDTPVGEVWNYSDGGSDILAEILRLGVGATPLEYGNEKLFGPIGIEDPPWEAGANGTNYGGWGLSLTSREMARFGELFRNHGAWMGTQVVPSSWVDASIEPRCPTPWGGQYAYHWWASDLPGFFNALGSFGQVIYVSRELELVVVFTANLPNETANTIFKGLIRDYIVPAVPR